jgi:hypothetical protein
MNDEICQSLTGTWPWCRGTAIWWRNTELGSQCRPLQIGSKSSQSLCQRLIRIFQVAPEEKDQEGRHSGHAGRHHERGQNGVGDGVSADRGRQGSAAGVRFDEEAGSRAADGGGNDETGPWCSVRGGPPGRNRSQLKLRAVVVGGVVRVLQEHGRDLDRLG